MSLPQNAPEVAIRRLTVAVWALVALAATGVGLSCVDSFRSAPADPTTDPIVGRWLWTKPTDHNHEILANGTLLCGGETHGTWRPLSPAKRVYQLFWRNRWTDTLTLSPDGNLLVGINNDGEVVEARRTNLASPVDAPPKSEPPRAPDMTPAQTASEAAVIILVNYTRDGDRYKATISEILKEEPGTDFNLKVGDEYGPAGFKPKENVDYGTGAIVFLPKDPSNRGFRKVTILGSIPAYDDMSLEDFRRLVRREP